MVKKGEGSSRKSVWSNIRLTQIHECQNKLFGKEKLKREYNLNDEA